MLPLLSDIISLSSSPMYSQSSPHPSSKSSTLCSLSLSMKCLYPTYRKTNFSSTSHRILADLNVKTTQKEVTEFFPFIGRKFVLKPVSVWQCFPRQQTVELTEQRPRSAGGVNTTARTEGLLPRYRMYWDGLKRADLGTTETG